MPDISSTQQNPPASVGDGGNKWIQYFGDPPYPWKTSAYDKQNRAAYNLPEAYQGKNLFLKDTLDQLIMFDETWYTQVALPIFQTDEVSVAWDKWEFNQNFTNLVPEQGVSRLVTSKRSKRQDNFLRRGLAMMMEHGFMEKAEGREEYFWNLRQIAMAVQETNNFSVIYAYLTAHNFRKKWQFNHGYKRTEDIEEIMEREKTMWAITQKQKFGLEKLDAEVVEWMNAHRGKANMWIFPPAVMVYLKTTPPEKTEYWLAGPGRIEGPAGAAKKVTTSFDVSKRKLVQDKMAPYAIFNDNAVYITRSFDVDRRGPIDIMKRNRQIGEYNLMLNRYYSGDYTEYTSNDYSIGIYDETKDRWKEIDLQFAIENCLLFNEKGELRMPQRRFAVEMYEEDVKKDFLTMQNPFNKNPNAGPVDIKFFGNISSKHMKPKSVLNLATTIINGIARNYNSREEMNSIWNAGIGLLRRIEDAPFNAEWFTKLGVKPDTTTNAERLRERAYNSRVMTEADYDASTGTIELPELGEGSNSIPLGYANWPGLIALSNEYDFNRSEKGGSIKSAKGYPTKIIKTASSFVKLFREIADHATTVLPGSIFTNPKLTSPWFPIADSETVLFENLVGHARHPIWIKSGGAAGAVGGARAPGEQGAQGAQGAQGGAPILVDASSQATLDNYIKELQEVDADAAKAIQELFGDEKALPAPKEGDPQENEKQAKRNAVITLLTMINADNITREEEKKKKWAERVRMFVNAFARPGQIENFDINKFFAWATNNVNVFNVNTKSRLERQIQRQKDLIQSARQIDAKARRMGAPRRAEGRGPPSIEGSYLRTPLTMSPKLFLSWKKKYDQGENVTNILPSNPSNPDFPADASSIASLDHSMKRMKRPAHLKPISERIQNDIDECNFLMVCNKLGAAPSSKIKAPVIEYGGGMQYSGIGAFTSGAIDNVISSGGYDPSGIGEEMPASTSSRSSHAMHTFTASSAVDLAGIPLAYVDGNLKKNFVSVADMTKNGMQRLFAQAYLGTPITKQVLLQFASEHVLVPMNFILSKPHMRYLMGLGIKAQAGGETGHTFMGNSDGQLSDDAKVKIHYFNYTYYSKAIVKRDEDVFIANDIHSMGTLGGAGTKVYSTNTDVYNPRKGKYGDGSMFVMAIPYEQRELPNPMDVSGRFYQFYNEGLVNRENFLKIHYNTAGRYNAYLGFRRSNDLSEWGDPMAVTRRAVTNTVMWEGPAWYYDRTTRRLTVHQENTGHWGHIYGNGAKDARKGKLVHFAPKTRRDSPL